MFIWSVCGICARIERQQNKGGGRAEISSTHEIVLRIEPARREFTVVGWMSTIATVHHCLYSAGLGEDKFVEILDGRRQCGGGSVEEAVWKR
jgi:hypothetical protein